MASISRTAAAGTKKRGSRQRRRSDQPAQAASGQPGQANQLPVTRN
jgi:hypothetical protein